MLKHLSKFSACPWLCFGDYNEIIFDKEKKGGQVRLDGQMQEFMDVIDYSQFQQLSMEGSDITWSNMQVGEAHIQERLDNRFFATIDWITLFPSPKDSNLPASYSDHNCLILNATGLLVFQEGVRNLLDLKQCA